MGDPANRARSIAGQVPRQLLPAGTQLSRGQCPAAIAQLEGRLLRRQIRDLRPDATGQPNPLNPAAANPATMIGDRESSARKNGREEPTSRNNTGGGPLAQRAV